MYISLFNPIILSNSNIQFSLVSSLSLMSSKENNKKRKVTKPKPSEDKEQDEPKPMTFTLDPYRVKKLLEWNKTQDTLTLDKQNKPKKEKGEKLDKYPYYGCSGGQLTYTFTPTMIGTFVTVEHAATKNKLEFSDQGCAADD